jgi:hypothetical protein
MSGHPYVNGAEAFRAGGHIGDCPHPHGSHEGKLWRHGFIGAQSDSEERNGGYARRHEEARSLFASEALTPEQQRVAALVHEVEDATSPSVEDEFVNGIVDGIVNMVVARGILMPAVSVAGLRAAVVRAFAAANDRTGTITITIPAARRVLGPERVQIDLVGIKPAGAGTCPRCGTPGRTKTEAERIRRQRLARRERPKPISRCCREGDRWS